MHYTVDQDAIANQDGFLLLLKQLWDQEASIRKKVIPKGPVWRRHLDQLQPRYGTDEDKDPGFRAKPTQEIQNEEGQCEKRKRRNPRFSTSDEYGPSNPRRSKRIQDNEKELKSANCSPVLKLGRKVL